MKSLLYALVCATLIIGFVPALPVQAVTKINLANSPNLVGIGAPEKLWDKTFGGTAVDRAYCVRQTTDGGYIFTGETESYGLGGGDIWLVKTDASGIKQWDKTFGGTNLDIGHSVRQTSDGGYVITGVTNVYGFVPGDAPLYGDVILIKTDAFGNQQWSKSFGGSNYDEGWSVVQTADGGYIIAGGTRSFGAGWFDFWLIKTDASGNQQWDKVFGGWDGDKAASVQQTNDGGYIITGYTYNYGAGSSDVWLIKTDASGTKQWDKTFGGSGGDTANYVQQASDGGYIITGQTYSYGAGSSDVWLIKTDASGTKQWDKTFGGVNHDEGYSVQQTNDGGYIVAGTTMSFGAGGIDIYVIKTDGSGNEVWSKTLGGSGTEEGLSVQQTADGGFIIAGSTTSFGAGDSDVWLIKVQSTTLPSPIADFTATPTQGSAPLAVQFTDKSTGNITSWSWTFGDTGTSTLQSPSHTYNTVGNYSVSLTVNGPGGSNTAMKSNYITISQQRQLPSQILSPVVGPLEVIGPTGTPSFTKWCFNQHQSSPDGIIGHIPGGGIGKADDTYAWDVNLYPGDLDVGKPVFAVDSGIVSATYGSMINAGGLYGQVLIEHNYQGSPWWSGYLHMKNIQVVPGQSVTEGTLLGYISNVSPQAIPNHLHFVTYTGTNTLGGLVSFNTTILERTTTDTTPPTVNNFTADKNTIALGATIRFSYSVSDTGGSGLKQVELWEGSDVNGQPSWPNSPTGYVAIQSLSGQNTSGYFDFKPLSDGVHWYGIHVLDNAGNLNDEKNSNTGGLPGVFGPKRIALQASGPPLASFSFPPFLQPIPLKLIYPVIDETITFDASASTPSVGITEYKWDFGDGSPIQTTISPKIEYAYISLPDGLGQKDYLVRLTVKVGQQESQPYEKTITIKRSPIILVHGFQRSAFDLDSIWQNMVINYTGKDPKGSEGVDWESVFEKVPDSYFMKKLVGNGYTVYISNYNHTQKSGTHDTIESFSKILANEIQVITQNEKVNKVDIVAHSMGGLISRTYIENKGSIDIQYRGDVRKLIMLGTPNQGVDFGKLAKFYVIDTLTDIFNYLCAIEMTSISPGEWISKFNQHIDTNGVEYSAIAGNLVIGLEGNGNLEKLGNDGLIQVTSVDIPVIPHIPSRWQEVTLTHSNLTKSDWSIQIVKDMLNNDFLVPFIDSLSITKFSPGELRVYDSQGRVTGVVGGLMKEEIPGSSYDQLADSIAISPVPDSYVYRIFGATGGTYGLSIDYSKGGNVAVFSAKEIPINLGGINQYIVDWNALSQGQQGVTLQIDSNGDGVFEQTIKSDGTLTGDEIPPPPPPGPGPGPEVGGSIYPVSKAAMLAPWLVLTLILTAGVIIAFKRRRTQSKNRRI